MIGLTSSVHNVIKDTLIIARKEENEAINHLARTWFAERLNRNGSGRVFHIIYGG